MWETYIHQLFSCKILNKGAGEMNQQLREFATLAEDPSLYPESTCLLTTVTPLLASMDQEHTWFTDVHTDKALHVHKTKMEKSLKTLISSS